MGSAFTQDAEADTKQNTLFEAPRGALEGSSGLKETILNIGRLWLCKVTDHGVDLSDKSPVLVGKKAKSRGNFKARPGCSGPQLTEF